MAIVVVGGHTRNIGKTTVMEGILRATPEMDWTAMKITQFGHGVCSANGEACDCDTGDHTMAISEERNRQSGSDTSRMLLAGAGRVLWVRTRQGQLAEAMPRIRKEFGRAQNILLESNSVLRFVRPDLYFAVLDASVQDFKRSALRYLDRADVLVTAGGTLPANTMWSDVSPALLAGKPVLSLGDKELTTRLRSWVLARCTAREPHTTPLG